jgi:hypothetical protein
VCYSLAGRCAQGLSQRLRLKAQPDRYGFYVERSRWRAWMLPVLVAVTVLPVSWWPMAVLAVAAMLGWRAWAPGRPGARRQRPRW